MHKLYHHIKSLSPSAARDTRIGLIFAVLKSLSFPWVIAAIYNGLSAVLAGQPVPWLTIGLFLGIGFLLFFLFHYLSTRKIGGMTYRLSFDLRQRLAAHLRFLPMGVYTERRLGEMLTLLTSSLQTIENVGNLAVDFIGSTIGSTFLLVIGLTFLYPWLGLAALITLLFIIGITHHLMNQSIICVRQLYQLQEVHSSTTFEHIRGLAILRLFDRGQTHERFMHKTEEAATHYEKQNLALEWMYAKHSLAMRATATIGNLVFLGLVLAHLYWGKMDLATTLTFCIVGFLIFTPFTVNANTGTIVGILLGYLDKLVELLQEPRQPEGTQSEVQGPRTLEVKNLCFAYEPGRPILKDISFKIEEGQKVAIVGPSGSGKTTLMSLLARYYDPTQGEIRLAGRDVREYTLQALLNQYSLVFQEVFLFDDTLANNIRFGKPNASLESVKQAAVDSACAPFIEALPEGYDTVVYNQGQTLSGGERQRISIARALIKQAPIVLLDEATSSVDPENEALIHAAIRRLTAGKTVISIAHRLSTVKNADLILVLDEGRLVQQGTHETLAHQPGLYQSFLNAKLETQNWQLVDSDR